MKKILLSAIILSALLFSNKLFAQPCSLKNFKIVSVSTNASGECTATVSFDMDRNNGNKYIYVHLWNTTEYNEVDKSRFTKGAGPLKVNIDGTNNSHPSLATVSIDNTNYSQPKWSALDYRPDATVTSKKGSSVTVSATPVSPGFFRYTVYGIPLGTSVSGGCSIANITGIVWSTQSNSKNSHIHCSLVGPSTTTPPAGDIIVTGSSNCATGMYTFNIQNTTNVDITGRYDIYADNSGGTPDMNFDPNTDTKFDGVEYFLITANSTYTVTMPVPVQYKAYDLWAQITLEGNNTILRSLPVSACGALAVNLKSFTASRTNQNVQLKWETSTEQNVKGFHVQRNIEGEWQNIAFVPTKADGGNSNSALSYSYTDANGAKGISQYRIAEVAVTGKIRMSDIKSVKGEGLTGKLLIYPNPSTNGRVNVMFENGNTDRDVFVLDAVGRIVKQYKKVNSTSLAIDNLTDGFYTIKVIETESGAASMEKVIIKKR